MYEIPGSPISRHDTDVIRDQLLGARHRSPRDVREVIVSSRRCRQPFELFGVPVRISDELGLHDGVLVTEDREPVSFRFENDS